MEDRQEMEDAYKQTAEQASQMSFPAEKQQIRSSSRKGKSLTEKCLEMHNMEAYDSWKQTAKETSKRADAEAELAAKIEQAKAMQEISDQQARLHKMENDWKVKKAKMQAEIKQRKTEMCLRLEEERTRLQMLKADKEVKVAAARVKAYNDFEGNPGDYDEERVDITTVCLTG
ncbi:uncharacterized [Tachysurus ichikawai]